MCKCWFCAQACQMRPGDAASFAKCKCKCSRGMQKKAPLRRLSKVAAPNGQPPRANQVPSRRFVYIGAVLGQLTIVIGARSRRLVAVVAEGLTQCLAGAVQTMVMMSLSLEKSDAESKTTTRGLRLLTLTPHRPLAWF